MSGLQLDIFSPRWSTEAITATAPPAEEYRDPFLALHRETLFDAGDARISFDEATWDYNAHGAVGVDVELYRNFLLICFKRFADGKRIAFEQSSRSNLDRAKVLSILNSNTIVSFNGSVYDLPIIFLALDGEDLEVLKGASDQIIERSIKAWDIEKELNVRIPRLNHIDLMEPNPSIRQGLKMIHGRLHGRYLVDLPYDPSAILTPRQMNVTTLYCFNDLDATELLYRSMREPLELRVALGQRYGMDLRSKSDAQIGEAIVKKRIEVATGKRIKRPEATTSASFRYDVPQFVRFTNANMISVVDDIKHQVFHVNGFGKVSTPEFLKDLHVRIGKGTYSMGIGGLHSTEAHRTLRSDERNVLIDVDVASQYPNIIKNLGLFPAALGPMFLTMYGEMIRERLAAKDAGDRVTSEGIKIALNGVYGKLGSPYSILYAPHLLIATTLTGQLAILMLIESAEAAGVPVVSANTDGVVFHCPRNKVDDLDQAIADWKQRTGFSIDKNYYAALHSSSVNTYIAVKEDGKVKRKGWISDPWAENDIREQIKKNPQMTILSEAAVRFLTKGESIEATVFGATDPRKFVTVIKSTAGATWRGHPLGKIIRYYWAYGGSAIMSGKSKVSKSDGARPLLELTDVMPEDVDRLKYCEEAAALLVDLGIT